MGRLKAITSAAASRENDAGRLDLLINCDGFNPLTQTLASLLEPEWVAGASLNATGRNSLEWGNKVEQRFMKDNDWDSDKFLSRYKGTFKTNYIAELLCRMAFLEPSQEDLENIELPASSPSFKSPPILIHTTTTRAAKIWPRYKWNIVLNWCESEKIKVGLVGAPTKRQKEEYHSGNEEDKLLEDHPNTLIDLRGRTSLIELAGACKQANAVISVDAGPMHVAAAVGTPTLAVVGNDATSVGASPIRLWQPRNPVVDRTISSETCTLCSENRFRNDACIAEEHICMKGVDAQDVINWIQRVMK